VPKTKPFGKLALLISDKHVWILQTTTTTTSITKAMPLFSLTIVAAQWICDGGKTERGYIYIYIRSCWHRTRTGLDLEEENNSTVRDIYKERKEIYFNLYTDS
jgi:hypothetical protein